MRRVFRHRPNRIDYRPHVIRTEADFDETLAILKARQKRQPERKKASLKQEFALAKGRARSRDVTLTDRVVEGSLHAMHRTNRERVTARGKSVAWTKEQVINAHATGSFKYGELARLAQVTNLQIVFWLFGKTNPLLNWHCGVIGCGATNSSARQWNHGKGTHPFCRACGCFWWEGIRQREEG
jgi:hypothetical protein